MASPDELVALTALVLPDLDVAACAPVADTLATLQTSTDGLSSAEAQRRLTEYGPNALRTHGVGAGTVFMRQLRNPLLILLLGAATVSGFTGSGTDAVIIGVIVALSVGLGFVNEYRSEQAVAALHPQIRHTALVVRDGTPRRVDVVDLVPGDIVQLSVGDIVPADIRLLETTELECDEAVLTGESMPVDKRSAPVDEGTSVVRAHGHDRPRGIGARRRRAHRHADRRSVASRPDSASDHAETAFQVGLREVLVPARAGRGRAHRLDLRDQPARCTARSSRRCCSRSRSRSGSHRSSFRRS